jgi:recombination protein RecA
VEHALDPLWATHIGVNMDNNFYISQPDSAEQVFEICETLLRTGKIDLIVVDSVASMVPQKEIDGDFGDTNMGMQARAMSQGMRKLVRLVKKSNTCVIFINQIRYKIGLVFGNPETTPGGNALKFYASVRIDIRKFGSEKAGEEIVANDVKVKIIKNKVAPPFKTAEFSIRFGMEDPPIYGIDPIESIIKTALELEIIEKTGSWLSYGDLRLGQGSGAACNFVRSNPDLTQEIKSKIIEISSRAISTLDVVKVEPENEEDEAELCTEPDKM